VGGGELDQQDIVNDRFLRRGGGGNSFLEVIKFAGNWRGGTGEVSALLYTVRNDRVSKICSIRFYYHLKYSF
jgi:hypothetical protein